MDLKRKAQFLGGTPDSDSSASKRRRLQMTDLSLEQTPQRTAEIGFAFLDTLRNAKDKRGRMFAQNFNYLPDPTLYPDYYNVIRLPLALETIEAKLRNREYPTVSTIEADVKRLISNAKMYNDKTSDIWTDSERIRKILSDFMRKWNPDYHTNPQHNTQPTPISDHHMNGTPASMYMSTPIPVQAAPPGLYSASPLNGFDPRPRRREPEPPKLRLAQNDFTGLSFQLAQEKLIDEMMNCRDQNGEDVSYPFINLPPRNMKDYYAVIPNPLSLNQIRKRIKGIQSRGEATNQTAYRSWAELAEEMEGVWKNARSYNEDGSEICVMATVLEGFFRKRIEEARAAVPEPAGEGGMRLKLKLRDESPEPNQKITLRLGPSGISGRSQDDMGRSTRTSVLESLARSDMDMGRSDSSIASPAALRPASSHGSESQGRADSMPHANGSMGMPMASYSQANGISSGLPREPPANSFESKWRRTGKDAKDALILNLSLTTHPSCKVSQAFHLDVLPSDKLAQQNVTIALPAEHKMLMLVPTAASAVATRQSKLFVTVNGERLRPNAELTKDQIKPIFEVRLNPGMNRLETEIIAGPVRGAPKTANGQDIDLERITVFAQLQKPLSVAGITPPSSS